MTIYQATTRLQVRSRYVAHVELDRLYRHRSRTDRAWRHAIVEVEPGHFWALLRTQEPAVVQESPEPAAWRPLPESLPGQPVALIVQYVPKKVGQWKRLYEDDAFAQEQVASRVSDALADVAATLLGRQKIFVDRSENAHSAPSAFIRIEARVKDPTAYESLMLQGIGGSRAFGLGLPIDPSTPLHALVEALAPAL